MKVKFIMPMAGTNPDGTALFINAHDEVDYPDFEAFRLIGSGICAALDPKDQEAALKKWAKLKDDEAKAAEAVAEAALKEAEAIKVSAKDRNAFDPEAEQRKAVKARKANEANRAKEAAHDKRMEARRAADAVAASSGEGPKESSKKLKAST